MVEILSRAEVLLSQIDTLAENVMNRLEQVGSTRQSILAAAFRGELVPQDPNDEPAEKLLERIRAGRTADNPPTKRGRRTAKELAA